MGAVMSDLSKLPLLPGAHYGKIMEQPKEDDPLPDVEGIDQDDDEDPGPTDPDLVEMLGFDPDDWEDEDEEKK